MIIPKSSHVLVETFCWSVAELRVRDSIGESWSLSDARRKLGKLTEDITTVENVCEEVSFILRRVGAERTVIPRVMLRWWHDG